MARRKKQKNDRSGMYANIRRILISVLAAVAVMLVLAVLFALAMSFVTVPAMALNAVSIVLLALTGFISGYFASKAIRKNGLQIGLICGGILSFLLFVLSTSLSNDFGWLCLSKMLVLIVAGAIGGVLGVNGKRKYR